MRFVCGFEGLFDEAAPLMPSHCSFSVSEMTTITGYYNHYFRFQSEIGLFPWYSNLNDDHQMIKFHVHVCCRAGKSKQIR